MEPRYRKLQPNVISLYESLDIVFFGTLFFLNYKIIWFNRVKNYLDNFTTTYFNRKVPLQEIETSGYRGTLRLK